MRLFGVKTLWRSPALQQAFREAASPGLQENTAEGRYHCIVKKCNFARDTVGREPPPEKDRARQGDLTAVKGIQTGAIALKQGNLPFPCRERRLMKRKRPTDDLFGAPTSCRTGSFFRFFHRICLEKCLFSLYRPGKRWYALISAASAFFAVPGSYTLSLKGGTYHNGYQKNEKYGW